MAKKKKSKVTLIDLQEASKYVRGGLQTVWFLINTHAVPYDMRDNKMVLPKEHLLAVAERLFLLEKKYAKAKEKQKAQKAEVDEVNENEEADTKEE